LGAPRKQVTNLNGRLDVLSCGGLKRPRAAALSCRLAWYATSLGLKRREHDWAATSAAGDSRQRSRPLRQKQLARAPKPARWSRSMPGCWWLVGMRVHAVARVV